VAIYIYMLLWNMICSYTPIVTHFGFFTTGSDLGPHSLPSHCSFISPLFLGCFLYTPHHLLHSHIGQFLAKKEIEFHTPNNMLGI
jgi:hypothetical protein